MLIKLALPVFFFILFMDTASAIGDDGCIESSLAAISGLLPGMDKASLDKASKFIAMETATGEDDGGYYEAELYHYAEYDITVVRGIIDAIAVTSPELLWAPKIKIGTDRSIVEKHIKVAPVVNDRASSHYVVCSSAGDVYAIFTYENNKVKTIETVIDRP